MHFRKRTWVSQTKDKLNKEDNPKDWDEIDKYEPYKVIDYTYLDAGRQHIHDYVDILSDIKIVPTAVNPPAGGPNSPAICLYPYSESWCSSLLFDHLIAFVN